MWFFIIYGGRGTGPKRIGWMLSDTVIKQAEPDVTQNLKRVHFRTTGCGLKWVRIKRSAKVGRELIVKRSDHVYSSLVIVKRSEGVNGPIRSLCPSNLCAFAPSRPSECAVKRRGTLVGERPHPATIAPAGSSRGECGSNEALEALGVKGPVKPGQRARRP